MHETNKGNPSDDTQIIPAVKKIVARTGKVPSTVVGDRGFGPVKIEEELIDLGVRKVGIPRTGETR